MTWIVLDETTKLLQTFVGRKKTTTEGNTMGSPPKRSDSNIVTFDIPPQQENDSGAGHDDNESSGSSLSSSFEGQSHYTMDEVVEVIGFGTFHWKLVVTLWCWLFRGNYRASSRELRRALDSKANELEQPSVWRLGKFELCRHGSGSTLLGICIGSLWTTNFLLTDCMAHLFWRSL